MQPGNRIKHYEILGNVGRGGMGVVVRARDTKLDRVVALKFLPQGTHLEPQAKRRFLQEARAASRLDHPNICTIHEIDETDDGRLYIAMGYYEGRTLAEHLEEGTFSPERAARIGRQLASALGRAHAAGMVHRDLKPANVMLLDNDEVKLLDFGVAKLTQQDEDVTATHGTVGTIAYMSPEQLRGETVDGRSDLWALGAVLHELLGGQRPFSGSTSAAVITAILQQEPEPLERRRPDVPAGLAALITQCLDKNRERRPADAAEVERRLDDAGDGVRSSGWDETAPMDTRPLAATPARRRRLWVLPVVALVAAVGAWLATRGPGTPSPEFDANRVVVAPFTVRGNADLAYLGEGMVDLIGARLDGIGPYTTVDPRIVLARIQRDGTDPADPAEVAGLARDLGAGSYLTGELLDVGGRLTLYAALQRVESSDEPVRASVEGTPDEIFESIDRLVADLATSGGRAPADRLARIAARTSRSLDATKAYLRGERAARLGDYRDAASAYDEAIAHDPDFALAHYRKSVVAEWIDDPEARSAAARALEVADGLPPRERALVEALNLRRVGRNHEAERAYLSILHRDPDNLDALTQLGEVYFHDNPRVGRDMFESMPYFERIVELEPENASARIHLARLQAMRGDLESLKANGDLFESENSDGERTMEVAALVAFLTGDIARQDDVVARLSDAPPPHVFYSAHGLARFGHSIEGARRVLEAAGLDNPFLLAVQASLYLEQGRIGNFRAFMESLPRGDDAGWTMYLAFVFTSGAIPATPDELSRLLERVRGVEPEALIESSWLPPNEDMTHEFFAFEIDYHVALLQIHTGLVDDAMETMHRMAAAEPLTGTGSGQPDAVAGLLAEIEWRAGNDEAALEALRRIEYEVPHALTVRSWIDGARHRFLRAELEREIGDPQVAIKFYEGLDRSWSWWDTGFRPSVYWGLARIAEAEGRTADAIDYYRRLLDLWRDCDPVLHEERDEVERALRTLED